MFRHRTDARAVPLVLLVLIAAATAVLPGTAEARRATPDSATGTAAVQPQLVELGTDGDGTPRAGYMVGRSFIGFLPE